MKRRGAQQLRDAGHARKCLELGADRVFDKSNEIDALILYCCRLGRRQPPATARYGQLSLTRAGAYWISPFFSA